MTSRTSSESSENTCVVCFKNVNIYSIGICEHPTCFECATRMRVLCRQNECPICRQDLPKVIFTLTVTHFQTICNRSFLMDKKFKICFENPEIQAAYNKLLEHACAKCLGRPAFRTFQNLRDHMRKEHELQYCDLCVENLMIFSGERRAYTRQGLAQHRRKGDTDVGIREHPLCEFCDQRYMDTDELYRHLRTAHLTCHFCDAEGFHHYYNSYDDLRDHFRSEHFLCEEGECLEEKFTPAFRTEIDLRAHRASVHGRTLGKAAAKQARTLELEFTLAPRPRVGGARGRGHEEESLGAFGGEEDEPMRAVNTDCIADFPTLGGGAMPTNHVARLHNGVTIRAHGKPPAVTERNFPALGGSDTGVKTVRLSVNSGQRDKSNNVSISVNHHRAGPAREQYPPLSRNKPANAATQAQWAPPPSQSRPPPPPQPAARFTVLPQEYPGLNPRRRNQEDLPEKFSNSCTVSGVKSSTHVMAGPSKPSKTIVETKPRANEPTAEKLSVSEATNKSSETTAESKAKTKKKKVKSSEAKAVTKESSEAGKKIKKKDILEPDPPPARRKPEVEQKVEPKPVQSEVESKPEVERKRSEIKIANLITKTDKPAPPPGFKPPPPGFSVTVSSVARPVNNSLTFTSSSGQSYSILPSASRSTNYTQPGDFARRNQELIACVMTSLIEEDVSEFRQMSTMFRQGALSAKSFLSHCQQSMGSTFERILPEMLVLLPDIDKQQELYSELITVLPAETHRFRSCPTCRQVVFTIDLANHLSAHSLDNHFPAL